MTAIIKNQAFLMARLRLGFMLGCALLVLVATNGAGALSFGNQQQIEAALITLNQARQAEGKPALTPVQGLDRVAYEIAEVTVRHNAAAKQNVKRNLDNWFRQINYLPRHKSYTVMASNMDGAAHMRAWLKPGSESRKVLLGGGATDVGIVAVPNLIKTNRGRDGLVWAIILAAPNKPAEAGWRDQVISLVNEFRAQHGLPPLKSDVKLNDISQNYAKRMALNDFVAHLAPEGDRIGQRVTKGGYQWKRVYENLHAGTGTPREAVNAWIMSKDGHREAMLAKDINEIGIGYYFMPFDQGKARFTHYWALTMAERR